MHGVMQGVVHEVHGNVVLELRKTEQFQVNLKCQRTKSCPQN